MFRQRRSWNRKTDVRTAQAGGIHLVAFEPVRAFELVPQDSSNRIPDIALFAQLHRPSDG